MVEYVWVRSELMASHHWQYWFSGVQLQQSIVLSEMFGTRQLYNNLSPFVSMEQCEKDAGKLAYYWTASWLPHPSVLHNKFTTVPWISKLFWNLDLGTWTCSYMFLAIVAHLREPFTRSSFSVFSEKSNVLTNTWPQWTGVPRVASTTSWPTASFLIPRWPNGSGPGNGRRHPASLVLRATSAARGYALSTRFAGTATMISAFVLACPRSK